VVFVKQVTKSSWYRLFVILLAGVIIFGLVGVAAADDWAQYGHDANHSGADGGQSALSVQTAAALSVRWSFPTGGVIADTPAVANGTVFFGSWDGYLYAVDAVSGSLKWKSYLGTDSSVACDLGTVGITSSPGVANGVVYVGGGDGNLYALDALTGQTKWKIFVGDNSAGNYDWSSPSLLGNGLLFLGVASLCDSPLVPGKLLEIDTNQQKIVATANLTPTGKIGASVWASASSLPTGGTVFVTDGNPETSSDGDALAVSLLALSWNGLTVEDGWQVPASQQIYDSDWGSSPVPFQTSSGAWRVGASNKNGHYYAFDVTNIGKGPVWEISLANPGSSPEQGQGSIVTAADDGRTLYVAGGNTTINGVAYPGSVRALNPDDGSAIWQDGAASGFVLGALATANGLLVDGAGPAIEVRNTSNGNILYSYTTGAQIYGGAAIANSWIYVGSTDGNLYALGLPTSLLPAAKCPTSIPTPFPPTATPGPSTIGTHFLGTTIDTSGSNDLRGSRVIAGASGVVSTVELFLTSLDPTNPAVSAAMYSDLNGVPGSLIGASNSVTPSTAGWQTISVPNVSVQAGQAYWLLFNAAGAQTSGAWSGGNPGVGWSGGQSFGSWPPTNPTGQLQSNLYSIAGILGQTSAATSRAAHLSRLSTTAQSSTVYLPGILVAPPVCQ
jgi:outer membrane protein assembly factor BamB